MPNSRSQSTAVHSRQPFTVYDTPEMLRAARLWTDAYLISDLVSLECYDDKISCKSSSNSNSITRPMLTTCCDNARRLYRSRGIGSGTNRRTIILPSPSPRHRKIGQAGLSPTCNNDWSVIEWATMPIMQNAIPLEAHQPQFY